MSIEVRQVSKRWDKVTGVDDVIDGCEPFRHGRVDDSMRVGNDANAIHRAPLLHSSFHFEAALGASPASARQ